MSWEMRKIQKKKTPEPEGPRVSMPCPAEAGRRNDGTVEARKEQSTEVQDGWNSALRTEVRRRRQLVGNRAFKVGGSGTRK